MVCDRCKMVVKAELEKLSLHPLQVGLGVVEISETLGEIELSAIQTSLTNFGFELLVDKKQQIATQIKTVIIELVHYPTESLKVNLSTYLSARLNVEYANLSAIFSEIEQQTLERYFILQKIERVKELIAYGEKSLSDIAYLLGYSSVAHLSAQFKKESGKTPTAYRLAENQNRKTLDQV